MISVVLPCYNEELSIQKNIDSVKKELEMYGKDYEIIVVDDGSNDQSKNELKKLDIKVVRHPHNMGYGAALKTGINSAKFDTIIISDIDDSYPSKHLSELLNIYFESLNFPKALDMVVGARQGKEYYGSFLKFIFRKILKLLVQWTVGKKIVDVNSGLRIFSKKTIKSFLPHLCNTFSFTTSLTLAYMLNTKFIKYHPIVLEVRTGKSHVKIIRDSLRTLQYIIEAIVYYNPLKLFLLFFIFFIITSIVLLILNLNSSSNIFILFSGFTFMISFISLFFGLLLELIRKKSNNKKNE